LVAVSTLALMGLVIGLLWHNAQLREAAEREQQLAGKSARQRDAARRAVNDMYTEVAEKWLSGEPRMSNVQRAFLEKALRFYEELAHEEEGPEQLLERAKVNRRSGAILAKLERRTEAEAAFRQAIALLESADIPGKAAELAEDYDALGAFLLRMQRKTEAETAFHRAKTLWESIPPDEAAEPEVRFGRADTLSDLAGLMMYVNRDADCQSFVKQGLPLIRGLVAEFPQEARYHNTLGAMLNHYGIATSRLGDPVRACEYLNEAIAHQAEAMKLDPRQPLNRVYLRNHYAVLAVYGLLALKRYSEATDAARKALDIAERLAADFPDVPHYQRILADAYCDLGDALKRSNQAPEAEQALTQAGKIQERVVAADPDSPSDRMLAGTIYFELANLRRDIGRYRDAVAAYRKALEFAPKDSGANNNLVWLLALGAVPSINDPAELVRLARTATETNPQQEQCWVTLGLAHFRAGDWAAAKAALEKPSKLSPSDDGMRNNILAMTEWKLGNKTAARTAYDRAVELLGQPKPKPGVIDDRRLQAEAARLLGVTDPATKP
jgi:tetratricopeptide (TPR) repeat protein